MLEVLQQNAPIISAVSSLGTLAIWTVYLSIFLASYRRQIKPMLIINRGEDTGLDARCLVTNMSPDHVHIQSMMVRGNLDGKAFKVYVTDAEDLKDGERPSDWAHMTRQGPLSAGQMADMGSFRTILDYAAKSCCAHDRFEGSPLGVDGAIIEIAILGIYGSEDLMIGATRSFVVRSDGPLVELHANSPRTHQISRRRERKRLEDELTEQL